MNAHELVTKLSKAWSTSDRTERRRLLGEVCEADAEFFSPNGANRGTEEYARGIDVFRKSFPKAEISHAPPDEHHRYVRFRWTTKWNDGRAPLEGVDFGELNDAGRLRRLVSFTDSVPR